MSIGVQEGGYFKSQVSVSEKSLARQTLNYVNEQYPYSWMKTDSIKDIIRNAENALNSNKIATQYTENIGSLMADFSFGYKYFLGKKRL
ncbi:hypothetical protein HpRW186_12590 [Helicobacter pylori]